MIGKKQMVRKIADDTKIDGAIDSDKGKVSPVKSFRIGDKMGFAWTIVF